MNTIIRKFIFLLSILGVSNSLYSSDILECNYHFSSYDDDSIMLLTIDGYKYRETICKPNLYKGCYFVFPVNSRKLNISYFIDGYMNNIPYLSCKYHHGFIINENLGYHDQLIKDENIPLLKTEYYYPKKHFLNIATLITLKPLDLKQPNLYMDIYFNNILKSEEIISPEIPLVSDKLQLDGHKGYNNIEVSLDTRGLWCSCPSIGNGFKNSRHFFAWITNIDEPYEIYINDNKYIEISIRNANAISI